MQTNLNLSSMPVLSGLGVGWGSGLWMHKRPGIGILQAHTMIRDSSGKPNRAAWATQWDPQRSLGTLSLPLRYWGTEGQSVLAYSLLSPPR